jgi:hypothetical protein
MVGYAVLLDMPHRDATHRADTVLVEAVQLLQLALPQTPTLRAVEQDGED